MSIVRRGRGTRRACSILQFDQGSDRCAWCLSMGAVEKYVRICLSANRLHYDHVVTHQWSRPASAVDDQADAHLGA